MAESNIGLAEPSTITKSLRSVTQTINSSVVHQEVMTIGASAGSSLALAAVTDATPDSTHFGLVTRSVIYDSGDSFRMIPGSTNANPAFSVRIVDSSGTGFAQLGLDYPDGSTTSTLAAPGLAYVNGSNTTMRLVGTTQPLPVQLRTGTLAIASTTTFITSTHSTAVYALVSSGAAQVKVFAVHVTSTHTRPSTIVFMSSLVGDLWAGCFGSGSSGVTGFNMAVTPPAYLFATRINEALNVRLEEQSTVTSTTLARVSFSYFTE